MLSFDGMHRWVVTRRGVSHLDQGLRGLVVYFLECQDLVGLSHRESGDDFRVVSLDEDAKSGKHGDTAVLELSGAVPS